METQYRVKKNHSDEEIVDVRGHFVTEVADLGSNTSPFKKQRTLGDCLPSARQAPFITVSFVFDCTFSASLCSGTPFFVFHAISTYIFSKGEKTVKFKVKIF